MDEYRTYGINQYNIYIDDVCTYVPMYTGIYACTHVAVAVAVAVELKSAEEEGPGWRGVVVVVFVVSNR